MKKDIQISILRMLSTVMVVSLHISQRFENVYPDLHILTDWLNLGLVMFFSISAFLYSKREITEAPKWYLHRYCEIAIPSVIVALGTILVFSINKSIAVEDIWGALLAAIGLQVYSPRSWMFTQLWFLTYILFFYLSVPFIQKIDCKKASERRFWGIFVGVLIGLQLLTVALEAFTGIPMLSTGILLRLYLPYFVFRRYDIKGQEIKPIMVIFTVLSALAIGMVVVLRYMAQTLLPESVVELLFVYTQSIAGFTLFYWLYKGLSVFKRYTWLLNVSDRLSYGVYLTHCLFIGYSTSLIERFEYSGVGVVLALLLTILSAAAVNWLSGSIKVLCKRKTGK